MKNIFKTEPARVIAVLTALVALGSAFGLGITDGQLAAIVAVVSAVLSLVGGEAIRSQVTPAQTSESGFVGHGL